MRRENQNESLLDQEVKEMTWGEAFLVGTMITLATPCIVLLTAMVTFSFLAFMSWTYGKFMGTALRVLALWALFILMVRFL